MCCTFISFVEYNLAKMEELNLMATFKQRQLLHPSHRSHAGQGPGGDGGGDKTDELKRADFASKQL